MASLDFPSNPTNNQTYSLNGVTYYYNAAIGAWLTQLTSMNIASSSNTQVLFNDATIANGSPGLTYNKSANTLSANTISVKSVSSPSGDVTFTSNVDLSSTTSYLKIPVGTTTQRPASPSSGMIRMNSTTGEPEWYDSTVSAWIPFAEHKTYSIDLLLVAGGGAASGDLGGGGGAGGLIDTSTSVTAPTSYSIVIGAGGAAKTGQNQVANIGSNSTAFSLTAIGGGYSGGEGNFNGSSGGSGGGGGYAGNGGSGTSGQGYSGGNGGGASGNYGTGGGGGAGAAGSNGSTSSGGNGGNGINWKSLGTYYAGGGGGSTYLNAGTRGTGGLGGGANGRSLYAESVSDGTVNTGGGGGGQGAYDGGTGGAGGSGIAIIRYLGSQRGSGGTVTSSGGYTYHTFTTSGTFIA